MNDTTRPELLRLLAELCEVFPEMRLGQLLCNLASLADDAVDAVWRLEDESLRSVAEACLAGQMERLGLRPPSFLAQRFVRAHDPEPLGSHRRLNLLIALRDCGRRFPREPFGRMIAKFAALASSARTVEEWAAATWDIEDESLLDWAIEFRECPPLDLEIVPIPVGAGLPA